MARTKGYCIPTEGFNKYITRKQKISMTRIFYLIPILLVAGGAVLFFIIVQNPCGFGDCFVDCFTRNFRVNNSFCEDNRISLILKNDEKNVMLDNDDILSLSVDGIPLDPPLVRIGPGDIGFALEEYDCGGRCESGVHNITVAFNCITVVSYAECT